MGLLGSFRVPGLGGLRSGKRRIGAAPREERFPSGGYSEELVAPSECFRYSTRLLLLREDPRRLTAIRTRSSPRLVINFPGRILRNHEQHHFTSQRGSSF